MSTSESLEATLKQTHANREEKADAIIWANVLANAGTAILPLGTSVVVFIGLNSTMIIALGLLYGYNLSKEQAAALIKQILLAVGTTWALGMISMKLGFEIGKVLGLGTGGVGTAVACGADAVMSSGLSYALGYTALKYFKNGCELDKEAMREIFKAKFAEGKERFKR
jgi:uncharacterized protein (DUF697 family)